jgi:hypothetical protein
MKRLICGYTFKRLYCLFLGVAMLALLSGCEEANIALDHLLGRTSPVVSPSAQISGVSIVEAKTTTPGEKQDAQAEVEPPAPMVPQTEAKPPAPAIPEPEAKSPAPAVPEPPQTKRRAPGEKPSPETEVKSPAAPAPPLPSKAAAAPPELSGKRRGPGQPAPVAVTPPTEPGGPKSPRELFAITRDPFRQPTEILPTECPPSSPLCRFDPAQLKLVGVIQVEEGQFKGMVEDPDGRGYFITSGMQIGRATVTQINAEGVTLHDHRTRKDVPMRLLREAREGREF